MSEPLQHALGGAQFALGGAQFASPEDRAALAEVLSRPEFRAHAQDGAALRRLLSDLWDRFLEALGTAEAERYASLGRAVFLVAVAVGLLLLWRAARRRRLPARAPTRPPPTGATSGGAVGPGAEAATAALLRGDLIGAVRQAYAAAAAALGGRGLRSAGLALTGPELAARSGDAGFLALARLHDRTLFGEQPVTEPEAREAVEAARRLAAGAGGGA